MAERARRGDTITDRERDHFASKRDQLDDDLKDVQAFCRDLGDKIKIDKTQLDEAVGWQVEAVRRLGDVAAVVHSQRDEAKDDIKLMEAETDEFIRRELAAAGTKVTETQVKNLILKDRKYQTSIRKHAMLVRDAARVANLRDAYKDRSYMVREMVTLFSAGYFADTVGRPRAPAGQPPYGEGRRDRDRDRGR